MHNKIKIDYIAKIEGHASFLADIVRGEIENARVKVEEGARLIEGILRNRTIEELPEVASRICGVCPIVHYLTSLQAIENALQVKISEQTLLLRRLMMASQVITSHILHLFFFSAPDFLGIDSDLELIKRYPDHTAWATKIRDAGNKIARVIGGRRVHPLTPTVGGFRKLPKTEELEELKKICQGALYDAENFANFFVKLSYPEYKREADYVCLENGRDYATSNGKILGKEPDDFIKGLKEIQYPKSVAKRTYLKDTYMVGALPRIKINNQYLNPLAKNFFSESKIEENYFNPFYNILAQAIEVVHFLEEAISVLDELLAKGIAEEKINFSTKESKGAGIMEAPRGILLYDIFINKAGVISDLNIITPTVQNLANLEKDLEDFEKLEGWKKLNKKEKRQKIAMLIRAYDPCITCATH